MQYQPVVPMSGYSGWRFLSRTLETQKSAFEASGNIQRKGDYFRHNIENAKSAAQLVADRRLLEVALGAYGLGDDVNSKAFVEKVLTDGTLAPDSLGNRLADKRYLALSKAFGFGDFRTANTQLSDFPGKVIKRYINAEFEAAVGAQEPNLRLALGVEGQLNDILKGTKAPDSQWFMVMGTPALRTVFEGAFGLPASIGALDIDKQLEMFKDRADRTFGTSNIADLNTPENRETLIRNFLLRSEISATREVRSSNIALALLRA